MPPDSTSSDRIARNEALFRQVNERVRDVSEGFATLDPSPIDFVCECGNRDCTEPISLTLPEYEAVRANSARFAVVSHHVIPEVERIVSRHGSYVVVEKFPPEAKIARETDPKL